MNLLLSKIRKSEDSKTAKENEQFKPLHPDIYFYFQRLDDLLQLSAMIPIYPFIEYDSVPVYRMGKAVDIIIFNTYKWLDERGFGDQALKLIRQRKAIT